MYKWDRLIQLISERSFLTGSIPIPDSGTLSKFDGSGVTHNSVLRPGVSDKRTSITKQG